MEPQTSPNKNDTITAPTASPRLPVNADANAQGGVPAERFGPIGNRTDIKQAIEAKQLGDRFGLNYDLVLRNLDRLRQAAALEDVTFGKFHLPFGIGEGTDAGSGNPAETPQSALNDKAQATSPSSRPSSAKKSDANHRFKSDAGEIISHAESTKALKAESVSNEQSQRRLTAEMAFDHYMQGSGTPLRLNLNQLNLSDIKPTEFPGFQAALSRGKDALIDTKYAFPMSRSSEEDGYLLGDSTLRLQGHLTFAQNGSWDFDGTYKIFDDPYDFNKSTHRGFIGELLTTIGRNTPGKPFDIEIRGSVPVSARGKRE